MKHYDKYSAKNPTIEQLHYQLAENHRLMPLLQDMDEHHKVQSKSNTYLQKNQTDANPTIDELTETGRSR